MLLNTKRSNVKILLIAFSVIIILVYSSHLYRIFINTSFNFVIDEFIYKIIAHFSNNSLMSIAMLTSLFVYCTRTFHLVMETKTYLTYLQKNHRMP